MSTVSEVYDLQEYNQAVQSLEDSVFNLEASVYGAMFHLQEAFDKEIPTAYALWHNLEQLKKDLQELRVLRVKETG